jgi:hypothetical protein
MSIINKITQVAKKEQDPNRLTQQELEYLLTTLKTTPLVGDQVEMFYNLVIKLQNQFIELQNNK